MLLYLVSLDDAALSSILSTLGFGATTRSNTSDADSKTDTSAAVFTSAELQTIRVDAIWSIWFSLSLSPRNASLLSYSLNQLAAATISYVQWMEFSLSRVVSSDRGTLLRLQPIFMWWLASLNQSLPSTSSMNSTLPSSSLPPLISGDLSVVRRNRKAFLRQWTKTDIDDERTRLQYPSGLGFSSLDVSHDQQFDDNEVRQTYVRCGDANATSVLPLLINNNTAMTSPATLYVNVTLFDSCTYTLHYGSMPFQAFCATHLVDKVIARFSAVSCSDFD